VAAAAAPGTEGALQAAIARAIVQTAETNLIYRAESCSVQLGSVGLAAVTRHGRDTGTEESGRNLRSRDDTFLRWLSYLFDGF